MKYLPYVLKHLRRNWIRTGSTVLGMAVCIFLFCTLQTVLAAIDYSLQSASASRLWTRHAVSLVFTLPLSYKPRIAAVPGVRNVAVATWFGGVYQKPENFFANFAVEMPEYLPMYPELQVPEDQKQALFADRRGILIGKGLSEKYGWKIGDAFQMESTIPPYRVGKPFEFVVRAIYDADLVRNPGTDMSQAFFHHKYLYEAANGNPYVQAGTYVVEINDPAQAGEVSKAIDALFENSDAQTKTETEGAFVAGFIALAGNLSLLLNGIGLAVTFTILLVTANTMSMAVQGTPHGNRGAEDAGLPRRPGPHADHRRSAGPGAARRRHRDRHGRGDDQGAGRRAGHRRTAGRLPLDRPDSRDRGGSHGHRADHRAVRRPGAGGGRLPLAHHRVVADGVRGASLSAYRPIGYRHGRSDLGRSSYGAVEQDSMMRLVARPVWSSRDIGRRCSRAFCQGIGDTAPWLSGGRLRPEREVR